MFTLEGSAGKLWERLQDDFFWDYLSVTFHPMEYIISYLSHFYRDTSFLLPPVPKSSCLYFRRTALRVYAFASRSILMTSAEMTFTDTSRDPRARLRIIKKNLCFGYFHSCICFISPHALSEA